MRATAVTSTYGSNKIVVFLSWYILLLFESKIIITNAYLSTSSLSLQQQQQRYDALFAFHEKQHCYNSIQQYQSRKQEKTLLLASIDTTNLETGPDIEEVTTSNDSKLEHEFEHELELEGNDDSEEEENSNEHKYSKSKWKKKKFLLMQDVLKNIKRGNSNAPKKAQEMVRRIVQLRENFIEEDDNDKSIVQAYNLWIHAIAKSKAKNAGIQAESILEEMKQNSIQPTVITYTSVIDAYSRSTLSEDDLSDHNNTKRNKKTQRGNIAAREAERIFFDLLSESERNPQLYKVSSVTYDTVLNAWAKQKNLQGAQRAQLILDRLEQLQSQNIKPTRHTYSTVINAWANSGGGTEAAEKAEELLERILSKCSTANTNNKKGSSKAAVDVVTPDTVIFNSVLHAWATSDNIQAGTKADALLKKMNELYHDYGYDTRPDIVTYNTVLSAWSHSGQENAPVQAERILKEMISTTTTNNQTTTTTATNQTKTTSSSKETKPMARIRPNTISYNTVLHAWSKSNLPNASKRAKDILEYMIKSNERHIAPDIISFTSVLNAIAKSKVPKKATEAKELLDTFLQMYEEENQEQQNENANNDEDDEDGKKKRKQSNKNKKRPKKLQLTVIPFNTVLNACAFSAIGTTIEEQRDALQIAVATLTKMKQLSSSNIHPDSISYGNIIKCFTNLMPIGETRNKMSIQIFTQCCKDGMVNELVWNEMKRAVQPIGELSFITEELQLAQKQQYQKHNPYKSISVSNVQAKDLPRNWRRKAMKNKRTRINTTSTRAASSSSSSRKSSPSKRDNMPIQQRLRNISEPSYQSGKDL